jgi:hypothetical protein
MPKHPEGCCPKGHPIERPAGSINTQNHSLDTEYEIHILSHVKGYAGHNSQTEKEVRKQLQQQHSAVCPVLKRRYPITQCKAGT